MIISPGRPRASRPSSMKATVSAPAAAGSAPVSGRPTCPGALEGSANGAPPLFDVEPELVSEHRQGGVDRRGDGGAEHADGGLLGRPLQTGRDVVADVQQEVHVLLAPLAVLDAPHDPLQPTRSLPARGALAARFA